MHSGRLTECILVGETEVKSYFQSPIRIRTADLRFRLARCVSNKYHGIRSTRGFEWNPLKNRTFTWCKLSFLNGQFEFEVKYYLIIFKDKYLNCLVMNASNKRRIDKKNVAFIRGRRLIMFLLVLAAFIPRRRLFVRYIQRRRKQSRAGRGATSRKRAPYFTFLLWQTSRKT